MHAMFLADKASATPKGAQIHFWCVCSGSSRDVMHMYVLIAWLHPLFGCLNRHVDVLDERYRDALVRFDVDAGSVGEHVGALRAIVKTKSGAEKLYRPHKKKAWITKKSTPGIQKARMYVCMYVCMSADVAIGQSEPS